MYLINERIGDSIGEEECVRLISQLKEQRIVTADEASLMASAISARALGIPVPDTMKGALRARIMKNMLMTVAARNRA
jgi:transcriptional regulator CtsR